MKEYDEDGNRVLHAVSLREAERYKHGMEERGFDARIITSGVKPRPLGRGYKPPPRAGARLRPCAFRA